MTHYIVCYFLYRWSYGILLYEIFTIGNFKHIETFYRFPFFRQIPFIAGHFYCVISPILISWPCKTDEATTALTQLQP